MECCLSKGELIRLDGRTGGMSIRCNIGSIWLTCGDGADHLIAAGRTFELPPRRTAVLEAMETAGFYLSEPVADGHREHHPIMAFTV